MTIWDVLLVITGGILGITLVLFLILLFSRIQMKGWLAEIESFLNTKFQNKFNDNEKRTQE